MIYTWVGKISQVFGNKISYRSKLTQMCLRRDASLDLKIKNAYLRAASKIRDEPKRNCSHGLATKSALTVDIALSFVKNAVPVGS